MSRPPLDPPNEEDDQEILDATQPIDDEDLDNEDFKGPYSGLKRQFAFSQKRPPNDEDEEEQAAPQVAP